MVGYQAGARHIVPDPEGVMAQVRRHDASIRQHQAGMGPALPRFSRVEAGVRIHRWCRREAACHPAVVIQFVEQDLPVAPAGCR